ncbi:MAG: GGDEF domain-containing protein [Lachnospiraceae bacterium]|nr:GGDEF domain-containing protein [Lachnospiraceae bacterium]
MKYLRLLRYLLYGIVALLGIALLLPLVLGRFYQEPRYPVTVLDEGWTVEYEEAVTENLSWKEITSRTLHADDAVLLMHQLPLSDAPDAALMLPLGFTVYRVYLEEELIATYGDSASIASVPRHTAFLALPEGSGGKLLSVAVNATQEDALRLSGEVLMGSRGDLYRYWLQENAYGLFFGIFFLVYGMLLLCVSVGVRKTPGGNLSWLSAAAVLICAGLNHLTYAELISFAFSDPAMNTMLHGASLWMLPAALMLASASVLTGRFRRIQILVSAGHAALALLMIFLHGMGRAAMAFGSHFLLFQLLVLAETAAFTALTVLCYRRERISFQAMTAGAAAAAAGGLINLFFFGSLRRHTFGISLGFTTLSAGMLLFIGAVMLRYYLTQADYREEMRRNKRLSGVAYTDPLTGLANRARCAQYMQELDREKAKYCIINYDVNGLKKINDTLGHTQGDRFLKGFAYILKVFFKDTGLVGRMGGDEYVVFLKDADLAMGEDKADAFQVLLLKMNRAEGTAFKYEASYGVAHSDEVRSHKSDDVYRLADDRMYEMKRMVHLRNGGDGRD